MISIPDTRTSRSIGNNTELASMAKEQERTLRSTDPSFRTALANSDISRDADDEAKALEHALESNNEDASSLLVRERAQTAAHSTLSFLFCKVSSDSATYCPKAGRAFFCKSGRRVYEESS